MYSSTGSPSLLQLLESQLRHQANSVGLCCSYVRCTHGAVFSAREGRRISPTRPIMYAVVLQQMGVTALVVKQCREAESKGNFIP